MTAAAKSTLSTVIKNLSKDKISEFPEFVERLKAIKRT